MTNLEVDPDTGEVFSKAPGRPPSPSAKVIERRLGTIEEVRTIREVVHSLLNRPDSLIENRVVSSGSHSGDSIDADQFAQLAAELAVLEQAADNRIQVFVQSMTELLAAARQERNPIVFL